MTESKLSGVNRIFLYRDYYMKKLLVIYLLFFSFSSFAQIDNKEGKCVEGDCINGNGTMQYSDGSSYTGRWKDSKADGLGTKTWANGQIYVGEFKNDKKDGVGTQTRLDGSKFVGYWKNGKLDGQGILTCSDGYRKLR